MQEAKKGDNVAISIDDITFGRQVKDNEILYTYMSDDNARLRSNTRTSSATRRRTCSRGYPR